MQRVIYWLLLGGLLISLVQSWQSTNLPNLQWTAVAVSETGAHQYAVSDSDGVFYSNDSGISWNQNNKIPSNDYEAIALSDNGSIVLIAGYNSGLYLSKNTGADFQVAPNSPASRSWYTVAMSADGQFMYAATFNESLYWSTDYGLSFTLHPFSSYSSGYFSIACDATGQYLIVGLRIAAPVIFSNNSGSDWYYSQFTNTQATYTGVAISRDGSVMVALASYVGIYVSRDFGDTWSFTRQSVALMFVACDASCQSIAVATFNSYLIQSFNQGQSWQTNRNTGRQNWFGVAADATGRFALAAAFAGGIYGGDLLPFPTAAPTMAPTARPSISFAPSRSPTTASPTVSTITTTSVSNASATKLIQTITIAVICVLGGGSCLLVVCMRICASMGCQRYQHWFCRLVANPYRTITGAVDDGEIVAANIEIVQTAQSVQVVGDIESATEDPINAAVKAKMGTNNGRERRSLSSIRNNGQTVAVATVVSSSAPDAIAIRAVNM